MTIENIVEQYKSSHPQSQKLHERAMKVFANGATHIGRVLNPFRPYMTHATGSRKWDVDGNEYIDYMMSHGALILGHSHPAVVKAVQEQMAKGTHYGSNHELEVEWAELIKSMMPSAEKVHFVACGQEADMMAIRLGRVFTGRKKVLKFEEHFHGWFDHMAKPGTPGVLPEDNMVNTVNIPSTDLNKVEEELAKGEYAVLMTEGGGAFMGGRYPLDYDFARALPELAHRYGTLWVLDEVVTGFRFGPGGWQGRAGVKPDLTVLGKCVGGGLSCGALVGRADIMEAFDIKTPPERRVVQTGTWNSNPVVSAAGVAALKILKTGEPQKRAEQAAAWLRDGTNKALRERGIEGRLYGDSILHIYLGPTDYEPLGHTMPPTKDIRRLFDPAMMPTWSRLIIHLLMRGIDMPLNLFVLSAAHTKDDVDQSIRAFGDSLDAMISEGTLMAKAK